MHFRDTVACSYSYNKRIIKVEPQNDSLLITVICVDNNRRSGYGNTDECDYDDDGVDINAADGGNIGCKLMSDKPRNDDRFTDLVINGIFRFFLITIMCTPYLGICLNINALIDS